MCAFAAPILLNRLRSEKQSQAETYSSVSKVPRPQYGKKSKDTFHASFEEIYGFRGSHAQVFYLSPWEFTSLWKVEYLRHPAAYKDNPRTKWTEAGWVYWKATAKMKEEPAPKAGEHYVVVEPVGSDPVYICYPDDAATRQLRHCIVMVRRLRPHVVQPSGTPLPCARLEREEASRIYCAYLRPWVLHRAYATAHVPHIADLDVKVSDALAIASTPTSAEKRRRLRGKQAT